MSKSSFLPHPFSLLDKMNEQDIRKKKKKKEKKTSNLDIEENKQEKGIVVSVLLSRVRVIVPNIIVSIPKFLPSQILELVFFSIAIKKNLDKLVILVIPTLLKT